MPNIAFYIIYTHAYQNGGKIGIKLYLKKTQTFVMNWSQRLYKVSCICDWIKTKIKMKPSNVIG